MTQADPPSPSAASDERLLEAFSDGDVSALGELARRHEGPLIALSRSMLGGRDDLARDAVQNAWVKVIRHARGFRRDSSFRTWIYRIVINACHDLRDSVPRPRAAQQNAPEVAEARIGAASDVDRALVTALAALTDAQRTVVLLGYHRDLTHGQIADILGVPMGTVKSRLHAALGVLRAELAREELRQ